MQKKGGGGGVLSAFFPVKLQLTYRTIGLGQFTGLEVNLIFSLVKPRVVGHPPRPLGG